MKISSLLSRPKHSRRVSDKYLIAPQPSEARLSDVSMNFGASRKSLNLIFWVFPIEIVPVWSFLISQSQECPTDAFRHVYHASFL